MSDMQYYGIENFNDEEICVI